MKRILFVIAFIFCFGWSHAQQITGGLNLGLCASQISGDKLWGYNKAGIFGGIYARLPLGEKDFFQMEIDFIQKGSRKNPSAKDPNARSYKLNLNYVEIPFLYRYNYSEKLKLEGGLYYSRLIGNVKEKINEYDSDIVPFKDFDAGFMLGLYYPLSEKMNAHIRSSSSLIPVRQSASGKALWYRGQYNSAITFGVSYEL